MNEKEALLVIEDMINNTKEEIKYNGFYYYMWGWLVLIAAVATSIIVQFDLMEFNGLPWAILMPLGGIITFISSKRDRPVYVKTYVSQSFKIGIIAFSVSLFIVCFGMPMGHQWKAFYPTIMLIYAIWLFVSGGLLKFKPLQYGAALNWLLAFIGFVWPSTQVHLILIAIGVLGGFIIPGHLLKSKAAQSV
ncbi:MAG: hypothetical protein KBE91_07390 [Bacteroidia bacterium]|nr:hypothetical protein [Bacteroidia bacterium]